MLPEIVTHTYHPEHGPFHNLCALSDVEAERFLDRMRALGRCTNHDYLAMRRRTEAWLAAQRSTKLGVTPLAHPIYFFVGDFDDGLDPARPCALKLPLALLPPGAITFTYGDSTSASEVLTLTEIQEVVAARGLPPRNQSFVELQLWDRAPLARWSPTT